jgi:ribose 1,5-bisphosphokinase
MSSFVETKGRLILVVGPSGVGKDSLIEEARIAFRDDPRYIFVRRVVTRKAFTENEDHDSLDETAFVEAEKRGQFALTWRAHGLCYGLPMSIRSQLAKGHKVIANISRSVVDQAECLCPHVTLLNLTADPAILAARIAQRGREQPADIVKRITRHSAIHTRKAHIVTIENNTELQKAAVLFIEAIRTA